MKIKNLIVSLLLVISITVLFSSAAKAAGDERYILIHLDAISAENFSEQLKAGNLPNIEEFFYKEEMRREAITYFSPFTPVVISRIREEKDPSEGWLVDWDGYSQAEEDTYSKLGTTLSMIKSMGRRSRENFFQGMPGLNRIQGLSLANLADLIEDYSVLEFYWFSTDSYGHAFGQDALNRELQRFDSNFARLVKRLEQEVNIIIYSDHGMTFGEGVEVEAKVESIVDQDLKAYSYPGLYLKESTKDKVEEIARKLVEETNLTFNFFWANSETIIGEHDQGQVFFNLKGERINYEYQGIDPFAYYEAGYEGQFLTPQEWVRLTRGKEYPAVPAGIVSYLSNPESGDIATVLDQELITKGGYVRKGNHLNISATDMTVPLLLRGPQLEKLYSTEYIWLPELFKPETELEVDFENNHPPREKHYFSFIANRDDFQASLAYSPRYRWRLGVDTFADDQFKLWGEYDLYSSYLHRFWLGAGIEKNKDDYNSLAKFRYDISYRSLKASYLADTSNRSATWKLSYSLSSSIDLKLRDFEQLGLGFSW